MRKHILILLLCIAGALIPMQPVLAEDTDGGAGFSISPINPETGQIQSSYYDLLVQPEEENLLKIKIYNSYSEDLAVKVEANNGSTNDNGITSYLANDKRDETLKVAFSDIAKLESEEIVVPKNGTAEAVVKVSVPAENFKGEILGGIRFTEKDPEANRIGTEATVKNNIAYTVGVVLREDDENIEPKMNLISVQTESRNARNYISATIQNTVPRIIKNLTANAKVYRKGEEELLYEAEKNDMRMAPNSNFNFGISLEDQPLLPGEYTLDLTGTADGKSYSFSKDFKITKEEAAEANKNAVYVENNSNDSTWIYIIIGALGIFAFVGLMIKKVRKDGGANH